MFDPTSRYYSLDVATRSTAQPGGAAQPVAYARRRFLPPPGGVATLVQYTVKPGDRLDNVAAVYLGDPTSFWRICDANLVFRPEELTETPGGTFTISLFLR